VGGVATIRQLVESGERIRYRLAARVRSMEAQEPSGAPFGGSHLPDDLQVSPAELPEWYLRCFRYLLATYGKESAEMERWNDYLREARASRPHLDESNEREVARAGAEDLAGAIRILRSFTGTPDAGAAISPRAFYGGAR
jgi:hypothetical protein